MNAPHRARDHGAQWPKSEALLVDVTQYCSSKAAIHNAYSPDTKGVKHVLKNEERKAGMSIKRPVTITARVAIVKKKRHTIKNPLLCFAADKTANQTENNWRPPNAKKYQQRYDHAQLGREFQPAMTTAKAATARAARVCRIVMAT